MHRCINFYKVTKSPYARCSVLPAPCSLFQQLNLLLSDYLALFQYGTEWIVRSQASQLVTLNTLQFK